MEVTTKIAQSIVPLVILLNLGKGNTKLCRNINPYQRIVNQKIISEVSLNIPVF